MSEIGHNNPPKQSVFRNSQEGDGYTIILNDMLQDERLSYDQIGLLVYLLSQPYDWVITSKIMIRKGCKKDKLYRVLAELTKLGYVGHEDIRDENNQYVGRHYWVSDRPFTEIPEAGWPQAEKPETGEKKLQQNQPLAEIPETGAVNGFAVSGKTASIENNISNKIIKEKEEKEKNIKLAFGAFKELTERAPVPKIIKLTDKRRKTLNARLQEHGLSGWQSALAAIERSNFLCGGNDRGWKADFDWLVNQNNFLKVLEGKYGNGRDRAASKRSPEEIAKIKEKLERLARENTECAIK